MPWGIAVLISPAAAEPRPQAAVDFAADVRPILAEHCHSCHGGESVQCAQCHNHKFDPVRQEEYYALQAVFAAIDRADRRYDPDPQTARRRAEREAERRRLTERRVALDAEVARRAGPELAELDAAIAAAAKSPAVPAARTAAYGWHSRIESRPGTAKWVQADLGRSVEIARVVLHPCRDAFNNIGDGFGFPPRFKVEVSDDGRADRPASAGSSPSHSAAKAAVGFEPTNNGFAIRPLEPLGYAAAI